MGHDMLHHGELKIFFEVLHMFEFIWIWNLIWIWNWKSYRKEIEKELENPEKKKNSKQPSSLAGPARPSQAARPRACAAWQADPACQRQLSLPRALPLSLAAQWGRPVGADFFTRALLLSLCLAGPVRQLLSRCPEPRFPLSLCVVDPPCQIRPPRARRRPASANSRTSPDFSATTPAHAPSSLLRAPPVPRTRPRLISHSSALPRALPMSRDAAWDPRPRSRPSSSPENAWSLPELRPEVRHLCPCLISLVSLCAWPILTSSVLGHGGPSCLCGGRPIYSGLVPRCWSLRYPSLRWRYPRP
jgi:hypothetical protein